MLNDDTLMNIIIQNLEVLEENAENVTKIKSPSNLSNASSCVSELKPTETNKTVKSRQIAAAKLSVERPQSAREKTKAKNDNKKSMILPHELGSLPKYLRKKITDPSLPSKAASCQKFVNIRPVTVDSSLKSSITQIKVPPKQIQVQGDVKSVASTVSDEMEEMRKQIATQSTKINRHNAKILELKRNKESLEKQLDDIKIENLRKTEELKSNSETLKKNEMQIVRYHKEQRQNEANAKKTEKLEIAVANFMKEKEEFLAELRRKDEATEKLKTHVEMLQKQSEVKGKTGNEKEMEVMIMKLRLKDDENEKLQKRLDKMDIALKSQKSSYDMLVSETKHLQFLLDNEKSDNKIGILKKLFTFTVNSNLIL